MCRRCASSWEKRYRTTGSRRNRSEAFRLIVPRVEQLPQRVRWQRATTRPTSTPCCAASASSAGASRASAARFNQRRSRRRAAAASGAPTINRVPCSRGERAGPGRHSTANRSPQKSKRISRGTGSSTGWLGRIAATLRSIHPDDRRTKSRTVAGPTPLGTTISTRPPTCTRAVRRRARALTRTTNASREGRDSNSDNCMPGWFTGARLRPRA